MKTNKTQKPSKDIRHNSLFTNITAEEEVFVRGGTDLNELWTVDFSQLMFCETPTGTELEACETIMNGAVGYALFT